MAIFTLKQTVFYRNQDTPVYMCFPDEKKRHLIELIIGHLQRNCQTEMSHMAYCELVYLLV